MMKIRTIILLMILMTISINSNATEVINQKNSGINKIRYENKKVTVKRLETFYEKTFVRKMKQDINGEKVYYTEIQTVPKTKEVEYTIIKRVPVISKMDVNENNPAKKDLVISKSKQLCRT